MKYCPESKSDLPAKIIEEEINLFKPPPGKTTRGQLYQRIDTMVHAIPEGQLATYGQIAKLVGSCGARQVGYAMAALAADTDVPWHRVINSQGLISARRGGEGHEFQRILLEAEGIVFNEKGRVSLEIFRWQGPAPEEQVISSAKIPERRLTTITEKKL